jgi:WD repeat-containing protein 61
VAPSDKDLKTNSIRLPVAVSTSLDSNVRVWDLENEGKLLHNILAPPGEAWTAKCSPDGTLIASGSYAGNLNIYKIDSGEQVSSLSTKKQFIMSTAYVCLLAVMSMY